MSAAAPPAAALPALIATLEKCCVCPPMGACASNAARVSPSPPVAAPAPAPHPPVLTVSHRAISIVRAAETSDSPAGSKRARLLPPPCGDAACPGCTVPKSLTVYWDTENALGPRSLSAGELASALLVAAETLAHGSPRNGGRVIAVHAPRFALPLLKSLRTCGVTLLDAGPKRGAVDCALKGALNDVLVDALLAARQSSPAAAGDSWLFVCSGDCDFADDVRRARRAGFRVGVVFSDATNVDFIAQADVALPWSAVLDIAHASVRSGGAAAPADAADQVPPSSPASALAPPSASSRTLISPPKAGALLSPPKVGAAADVAQGVGGARSSKRICRDFAAGGCPRGDACRYAHVVGEGQPPCRDFLLGKCKRGVDCRFSHAPGGVAVAVAQTPVMDAP